MRVDHLFLISLLTIVSAVPVPAPCDAPGRGIGIGIDVGFQCGLVTSVFLLLLT